MKSACIHCTFSRGDLQRSVGGREPEAHVHVCWFFLISRAELQNLARVPQTASQQTAVCLEVHTCCVSTAARYEIYSTSFCLFNSGGLNEAAVWKGWGLW